MIKMQMRIPRGLSGNHLIGGRERILERIREAGEMHCQLSEIQYYGPTQIILRVSEENIDMSAVQQRFEKHLTLALEKARFPRLRNSIKVRIMNRRKGYLEIRYNRKDCDIDAYIFIEGYKNLLREQNHR